MDNSTEVGLVTEVNNFLLILNGFPSSRVNDLIISKNGEKAWISALFANHVEAFLLDETDVKPGQLFQRTKGFLGVTVGEFLIGRTINPLGVAIDGKGLFPQAKLTQPTPLDKQAPGIKSRRFISSQFETGITIIDSLIPIGKGQRELIVCDARSGKENFLIDLIVNQKRSNVICIYAAIGKPISAIRSLIDTLDTNKTLDYTIVIATSSTDPAPLIFLTPQTAFTIAEYFQKKGKDVLLILDDLGNHAKVYREMSLLAGRIPGREAYPGDVFYQHSHLLERAGSFSLEEGGGSITAIPTIEINLNDFTTLIPTNLMSMTDGHLLFRSSIYNQGQRPAIDISLSVTRVGAQTQTPIQKSMALKIKSLLTQAGQLSTLTSFGAELSPQTQLITKQGEMIKALIRQETLTFISKQVQIMLLALVFTNFLITKDIAFITQNKLKLIEIFSRDPEISKITNTVDTFNNESDLFSKLNSLVPRLDSICR